MLFFDKIMKVVLDDFLHLCGVLKIVILFSFFNKNINHETNFISVLFWDKNSNTNNLNIYNNMFFKKIINA